ncbi:2-hydroxyacyl-CoA dehydratase [bacterium]|nr:2-hydroxyacyl-CoA dehydratase [bacterium]
MTSTLVGRANEEAARLFRDWFSHLNEMAEKGHKTAYVFVMGSMCEVLRSFDIVPVFPEINSLQTAVKKVSHDFLARAEDYGFSPDVCGYVKADVAVQLNQGIHPLGRIPRPSLAIATNACNTYIKWAEFWERLHHTKVFTLDIPGSRSGWSHERPGEKGFDRDRRYVEHQIGELISACEEITGRPFDIDRLRQTLDYTNQMSQAWHDILLMNRKRPAPFNSLTEGTVYLGVLNALRGTPEGARYMQELREEIAYRADHNLGPPHQEKYRLMFLGVPCYPIFRRFYEFFSQWGGCFVTSTYLWFASGGLQQAYQYDLNRPLESLAEGTLVSVRSAMDSMFFQDDQILKLIDEFALEGIVFHPIKSCRTVSTGLADVRQTVLEKSPIASLFIESDMMDRRVVSEAQLKNRIDAFFEGMAARRVREGRQ